MTAVRIAAAVFGMLIAAALFAALTTSAARNCPGKRCSSRGLLGWYLRDRWQVSQKLTLSIGLRYELRQLPASVVGSVAYVGTQTTRSFADLEINAAPPGGGTAGRPLNAAFGHSVDTWAWNGYLSANYHALQVALNRRVSNGLTLKGAYTYSKAINFTDEDGWTGTIAWNWQPAFGRNRARAGYDIPHVFQMGFVYELPAGKGKKHATSGPAKWVLGDWQLNGVFASFQGRPFTVGAATGALNAPSNTQTADQVRTEVVKLGASAWDSSAASFLVITGAQPDQRQVRLGLRLAW